MTARRSVSGIAAATTAFLLPVAYSPSVNAPFWSPKAAVLMIAGAAGLPALLLLRRTALRPAAIAAACYLAAAGLAALLSPDPGGAVFGLYNWGTGLMFLGACVGVWALGCTVAIADRGLVLAALVLGICISIAVAVLQALDAVGSSTLQAAGRASGLAGNPVHLGTIAAALVALGAARARTDARWIILAGLGAGAIQLSGTRLALVLLLPIVAAGAVRAPRRAGLVLVAAVALGLAGGSWLTEQGELISATGRAADDGGMSIASGGGSRVRLEVWSYARHAVARDPLLGSGPGRFRAATSADRTLYVARYEGGDNIYSDAHNIVVEHLVTTGLIGAAAFIAWLLLGIRRARGDFLWVAVAIFVMALAQPMSVGTTPILFLTLGVASSAAPNMRLPRAPAFIAGGLAVVAATALVIGDIRLNDARLDFDVRDARAANALLRPWPEPATIRARIYAYDALTGAETEDDAIAWRRRALRRDPTDPALAILLAREERGAGRLAAAERHYRRALRHNPWSTAALTALARLHQEHGDHDAALRFARRAALVRTTPTLQRLLRQLENAERPGP